MRVRETTKRKNKPFNLEKKNIYHIFIAMHQQVKDYQVSMISESNKN